VPGNVTNCFELILILLLFGATTVIVSTSLFMLDLSSAYDVKLVIIAIESADAFKLFFM
jgi:hypothetical protein